MARRLSRKTPKSASGAEKRVVTVDKYGKVVSKLNRTAINSKEEKPLLKKRQDLALKRLERAARERNRLRAHLYAPVQSAETRQFLREMGFIVEEP